MKNLKLLLTTCLLAPIISHAQSVMHELNSTTSCDSTCAEEIAISTPKSNIISNQVFVECPEGYEGKKVQTTFIDKNSVMNNDIIESCTCKPQTFTQTVDCPISQRGEHIQTRDWSCSGNSGKYTNWTTKTNTCATYPISFGIEERTIACPIGQIGVAYQNRTFTIYSDNSKQNYSEWTDKGNTCKVADASTSGGNNSSGGEGFKGLFKYHAGKTLSCQFVTSRNYGNVRASVDSEGNLSITVNTANTSTTCNNVTTCRGTSRNYPSVAWTATVDLNGISGSTNFNGGYTCYAAFPF